MINVDKLGAYYFPLDKKPRGQFMTLELYSELSLSSIVFDEVGGEVVGDYFLTTINSGMTEQISNGEYNYTLYDNVDGEKVGIGLIRFDLEEGGQTDDEEYIIYQNDFDGYVQAIELTETGFTENGVYEAEENGWYKVTVNVDTQWWYTSGYTDGFDTGYQSGNTDGVNATLDWFYFRSRGDGHRVYFTVPTESAETINLEYSFDKMQWQTWDFSNITLNSGETVYFRGDNPSGLTNSSNKWCQFHTFNQFDIGGDLRSLLDKTLTITTIPCTYCFAGLFAYSDIVNVDPKLLCGFETLSNSCFYSTFRDCRHLLNTPELPFELKNRCYYRMFARCVSLTKAPDLLQSVRLSDLNYCEMFDGCTSLTYVKCLATTNLNQARDILKDVSTTGTFVRDYNADWSNVQNGIPSGWTVLVDNVPESALS